MQSVFFRAWFWSALILSVAIPAWADGVALPKNGGVLILNGRSLTEAKQLQVKGDRAPLLAVHPSSNILAGLADGALTFWNLPSYAEASRHVDPLFDDAADIAFSADGTTLYILSPSLGAVLRFELASSKVVGTLPVPGGPPRWMSVTSEGVLVGQEHAVCLVSADPETGLLAQYLFPEKLKSAAMLGGRIFLGREGAAGLDSFEAKTGRMIAFYPTSVPLRQLLSDRKGSVLALTEMGEVQAWTPDATRPKWRFRAPGLSADRMVTGGDGATVYLFDSQSQVLVALDTAAGTENARITLSGVGAGLPVIFSGTP